MGAKRFLGVLVGACLLLTANSIYGQLSKTHYIPPLTSAEFGNANPLSQYFYISTPSEVDVAYTIKPMGLPESSYITGTVSNSNPSTVSLGSGNGQLFVPSPETSTVMQKGYIIEAEDAIYVSVRMNGGGGAQAGALVSKGITALGTRFRTGSYTNENPQSNYLNFLSVMASEDGTTVTIDDLPPSLSIKNYTDTKPVTVLLNEGESYVLAVNSMDDIANRDGLIGALVTADKPVAVNCGSANGSFHNGTGRDFGIDQIVDASKTGDEYIFVRGDGEDGWENVLIVADQDNTAVYVNGKTTPNATLNAGEYHLIEGDWYSPAGNLHVATSKDVFAYQGVGATESEANQGMFFVPPLSCETRGNVNNIAQIEDIGSTVYTGGITIVTKKGAAVQINNADISIYSTQGPSDVVGNDEYVTYRVMGLTGNISVTCDSELYCAYFNFNGVATSGSFYSGFPTAPEINFEAAFETLGNCIPNITLSAINTENFDSLEWYIDEGSGFVTTGITEPQYVPQVPGRYKLIGFIACTGLTLESVEVPVSYCPADSDVDGIIDNLDVDNDNDGILNCTESFGNAVPDLTNLASPVLNLNDGSVRTNLINGDVDDFSSAGTLNSITGFGDGTFQTVVNPANQASIAYTMSFVDPSSISFVQAPGYGHSINPNESFIVRIYPSGMNITLIDPDHQLLIDTDFDGVFDTEIEQLSGSEIHFKINPNPDGNTPFEFRANQVEGFTFIHQLADITGNASYKGFVQLTCLDRDTDGDGIYDAADLDSDNDGIPDIIEVSGGTISVRSFTDSDLDGLDDLFEPDGLLLDSDGDGVLDFVDLDSDNDGVLDVYEAGLGQFDQNLDGQLDMGSIGDNGLDDQLETAPDSGQLNYSVNDQDNDGLISSIDDDRDGDDCPDVTEAGYDDSDSNGIPGTGPAVTDPHGRVDITGGYRIPNPDYALAAVILVDEQPPDTGICLSGDARIEIMVNGPDTFQWEWSTDGVNWTVLADGVHYQGTDTSSLLIRDVDTGFEGYLYRVFMERAGNSCGKYSEAAMVTIHPLPELNQAPVLKQCDDDTDGFSAFNLTEVNAEISNNHQNETFSYHPTLAEAEAGINAIANPAAYINVSPSIDQVWARVESIYGCASFAPIDIVVSTTQIPADFLWTFNQCDDYQSPADDDRDGVATFDFSSVTQEIENVFPVGQQIVIMYYRNKADALAEKNPIADPSLYRNEGYPGTQEIYIRVDSELDNDCLGLGHHITLNVEALPVAHPVQIDRQCDDDHDGLYPFDTSTLEADLLQGQTGVTVAYYDENNQLLASPLPNPFITGTQDIRVRVTNNLSAAPDGPCYDETTLTFIVDKRPEAYPVALQPVCDDLPDDRDGIVNFDTTGIHEAILKGQTDMEVFYFDESGSPLPSPLPNPFPTGRNRVEVQVINPINTSCVATTYLDFVVNPRPEFQVEPERILCLTDPQSTLDLIAEPADANEDFQYSWTDSNSNLLGTDRILTIDSPGVYFITLTKTDGTNCERTLSVNVKPSEIARISLDMLDIRDDSDNNAVTVLDVNGGLGVGDYEFALDDEFSGYQEEGYFDQLEPGVHRLYIRDRNGCGTVFIDFPVIGFPRFFTPNGDGYNDYWKVLGVTDAFYNASKIYVFDRYGKLVAQVQTDGQGWDGSFGGELLPSTDYWFLAELVDHKGELRIKKGHFSLVRR